MVRHGPAFHTRVRVSELGLTGMDDLSPPESLISTFPKCKMAARTLKTSD